LKVTRRKFITLAAASAAAMSLEGPTLADEEDKMDKKYGIPRKKLGKTGESVSILAFGGFHLVEVMPSDAERMLNYYLDEGGNFIETAISYGDSEKKIGQVMKTRRDECFLSTKTHFRTKKEAADGIDASLKNLQTDHIDNLFVHCLTQKSELDTVLGPNGAMEAIEEARDAGKIRFVSVTAHSPELLYQAITSYKFDAMMEWINYYDYFNFPMIYKRILPYCREQGMGVIAMKPIADGLLWKNASKALRWVWSVPVDSIAAGNNNMDMLKKNIKQAKSFKPMAEDEKQDLYETAPEYAGYVCRQCAKCLDSDQGLDIKSIFAAEGYFDRQMYTGNIPDPAEYALRERLRFWFGNQGLAQERYSKLKVKVPKDLNPKSIHGKCPYGIDVPRKLRIAAWKLTGDSEFLPWNV
jgi:predicted aldo/keto reductase-like oxidoreductase